MNRKLTIFILFIIISRVLHADFSFDKIIPNPIYDEASLYFNTKIVYFSTKIESSGETRRVLDFTRQRAK